MNRIHAFTLIEMLVTIAIVAILAAVALPSYQSIISSGEQKAAVTALIGSLHFARSEAVKRSQAVVLCTSSDNENCTDDTLWSDGWIIFVDADNDSDFSSGDEIIKIEQAQGRNVAISTPSNLEKTFRYRSNGQGSTSGLFTVCDSRGSAVAKAISINATGRPQVTETDTSGGSLTCPS